MRQPPSISVLFLIALSCFDSGCASNSNVANRRGIPIDDEQAASAIIKADHSLGPLPKALSAADSAIDVVENNIANSDTIGFKRTTAHVVDGVAQLSVDMAQGSMEATGHELDVGIQGEGFIQIKTSASIASRGVAYTRNGTLMVNNKGQIVVLVGDGYIVEPAITLPINATNISIGLDGTVRYVRVGTTTKVCAGQIKLATFPNPHKLQYLNSFMYAETDASGPPVSTFPGMQGAGQILSGYLEFSNVSIPYEQSRLRFLHEWREAVVKALELHSSQHQIPSGDR